MQFLVGREGQRTVAKLSQCPKRPISWTTSVLFHAEIGPHSQSQKVSFFTIV